MANQLWGIYLTVLNSNNHNIVLELEIVWDEIQSVLIFLWFYVLRSCMCILYSFLQTSSSTQISSDHEFTDTLCCIMVGLYLI